MVQSKAQKHPAKFTKTIMGVLQDITISGRILDPFAGTGRIHQLAEDVATPRSTWGVEIEPEWATLHPRTIVGNALCLPFCDASFDAIVTSCTYGNRLADHHNAKDGSLRHSYTHTLGRKLHPENSGALHWGDEYRSFHVTAWKEVARVLRVDGQFVLNIKDHVRRKEVQPVSEWHKQTILSLGFTLTQEIQVKVPSLRYGANRERTAYEWVYDFRKN